MTPLKIIRFYYYQCEDIRLDLEEFITPTNTGKALLFLLAVCLAGLLWVM
jgi:hypothetical protein